jgi:hypothetical protein
VQGRRGEGGEGVSSDVAYELLNTAVDTAARLALGDGLSREEVGAVLDSLAYAIRTQDVAEDMSPLHRSA